MITPQTQAIRNKRHLTPDYAPAVNRGRTKSQRDLEADKLAKMVETHAELVAARHAPEKPGAREWIDLKKPKVKPPSTRPLSSYTRDQQRILEVRLYALRTIHGKKDPEISQELDVAVEDLDELAGMAGKL